MQRGDSLERIGAAVHSARPKREQNFLDPHASDHALMWILDHMVLR